MQPMATPYHSPAHVPTQASFTPPRDPPPRAAWTLARIFSAVASPAFLLAGLVFFLPWYSVSCAGYKVATGSGFEAATTGLVPARGPPGPGSLSGFLGLGHDARVAPSCSTTTTRPRAPSPCRRRARTPRRRRRRRSGNAGKRRPRRGSSRCSVLALAAVALAHHERLLSRRSREVPGHLGGGGGAGCRPRRSRSSTTPRSTRASTTPLASATKSAPAASSRLAAGRRVRGPRYVLDRRCRVGRPARRGGSSSLIPLLGGRAAGGVRRSPPAGTPALRSRRPRRVATPGRAGSSEPRRVAEAGRPPISCRMPRAVGVLSQRKVAPMAGKKELKLHVSDDNVITIEDASGRHHAPAQVSGRDCHDQGGRERHHARQRDGARRSSLSGPQVDINSGALTVI